MDEDRIVEEISEALGQFDCADGHPLRTPECPALTKLSAGFSNAWSDEDFSHMRSCAYCERILAIALRDGFPGWTAIVKWLRNPSSCPVPGAFNRYVNWTFPHLQRLIEQSRNLLVFDARLRAPSAAMAFADDAVQTEIDTFVDNDSRVALTQTVDRHIVVSISIPLTPLDALELLLVVSGKGGEIERQLILTAEGSRRVGSTNLGRTEDLTPFLGLHWLVTLGLRNEPTG